MAVPVVVVAAVQPQKRADDVLVLVFTVPFGGYSTVADVRYVWDAVEGLANGEGWL